MGMQTIRRLPVIDIAPLVSGGESSARDRVAKAIREACRESGFFYAISHGIEPAVLERLEAESRRFFSLAREQKMEIAMAKGGKAWRGYFPVGAELTSGRPDLKEGIYFGSELPSDHPRVAAGLPLHGSNLWPETVPELRATTLAYMAAAERAAHAIMEGISLSLGLKANYFSQHYTAEPTVLFRIFHYPAEPPGGGDWSQSWGAGEHTDYGLLTLLAQDDNSALQVKTPKGWIEATPVPGALVCNIGDMLERLTGGWFHSTPHRVLNRSGRDRLSFPFFFDPDFMAEMKPLPPESLARYEPVPALREARWDGADLGSFEGTYGDYLISKVSKVFPELGRHVL